MNGDEPPTVRRLPEAVEAFLRSDDRIERCPADAAFATVILDRVLAQEGEDTLHAAAQGR